MIEHSSFKRLSVFGFFTLAKGALLQARANDGSIKSGTKAGLYNVINAGVSEALTAAKTLTVEDSGKTFLLNNATGFTVTLPAIQEGLKFTFIVETAITSTNAIIDSAEGDNISGMIVNRAGVAGVAAAAEDQLNFVANQTIIGDRVELNAGNGGEWYVTGWADVAAGITATDPS